MKTQGNDGAFAVVGEGFANPAYHGIGLTKREYFAGLALQGLLSADTSLNQCEKSIAEFSVKQADALIKELNK